MTTASQTATIKRLAQQLTLDPKELAAATSAVWSNLNPQVTRFEQALSVAASALQAVRILNLDHRARQQPTGWGLRPARNPDLTPLCALPEEGN